jgi:ADP-ribose pyrophosphatase YjhB (NUDIX family)
VKRYAYCPVCGAAFDKSSAAPMSHLLHCARCGFDFWQNSKPAVAAIVLRQVAGQPHVLLTRRGIEPYKNMWDLPGGFLNNGEHPEQGLARELAEELGTSPLNPMLYRIEIEEYPRDDVAQEARFVLSMYYRCDLPADAVLTPADDVEEAAWYPLHALPEAVAFPANRRVLMSLRESRAAGGAGAAAPKTPGSSSALR